MTSDDDGRSETANLESINFRPVSPYRPAMPMRSFALRTPAPARRSSRRSSALPRAAAQPSAGSEARRLRGLADYAALKRELLKNTGLAGASLSAYLLLADLADAAPAASAALGAAGSLAYVALLCRHVDSLGAASVRRLPLERNPGAQLGGVALSALRRLGDVYYNALAHPQLLVPVLLAALSAAWAQDSSHAPVRLEYLLLGFLSYKAAALNEGFQALKRVTLYAAPETDRPVLPDLPSLEDLDDSGGVRRMAAALLLSLPLLGAGAGEALAAPEASCQRTCLAECNKLAPGSGDYCTVNCAAACDPHQVLAAKASVTDADLAGPDEGGDAVSQKTTRRVK